MEVTVLPGHELLRVPSGLNLKTSVARGSFIDPSLESCGTNAFSKGHLWKAPGRVCREGRYRKVGVSLVLCGRPCDGNGLGRRRRFPGSFCFESCPCPAGHRLSRRSVLFPAVLPLSLPLLCRSLSLDTPLNQIDGGVFDPETGAAAWGEWTKSSGLYSEVTLLWDGEKYVGEYRSNMDMSGSLVLKPVSEVQSFLKGFLD